ncbi:thioredoxin family protein [Sulfurisphaera ohwakuensis]|uniref:thioredoxin family protein n=1 Tax=Sulfurisphaera ohwakuensis TaxID=69656 RepID=UPI0036F4455B
MKVEIFTHKNCIECNFLIEFLENKGLLSKVTIIDTELYPFLAFERGVISTPSIFVDGKLIFAGVVDYDELLKILSGEKVSVKINKEELIDKLMFGIINSFAATAWLYVNKDFDALMAQKDFVFAITGLALISESEAEEMYNYLRNVIVKEGDIYFEKWKDTMKRVISSNFIRELYWLYEKKLEKEYVMSKYPIEVFAHWLMVRGGAVGRVGLRIHPLSEKEIITRISEVYIYLFNNYDSLWDKVIKEQEEIRKSNKEQVRFLNF